MQTGSMAQMTKWPQRVGITRNTQNKTLQTFEHKLILKCFCVFKYYKYSSNKCQVTA